MSRSTNDRTPSVTHFRVYTDIVGDLFHGGHVSFLERVRETATAIAGRNAADGIVPRIELVVGLMNDDEAASYKRLPVLTLAERTRVVEACRHVDVVIPGCPAKVDHAFIEENHISLVVHGDDFDETTMREHYDVPIDLGIFATVAYSNDSERGEVSTTTIIDRILSREAID
jgi:glycerol-3-phosphate cytidylyltransferase-like family protein